MAERAERAEAADTGEREKTELDERRIARAVAIGLPIATVTIAVVVGMTNGAAMAILVLAAGVLLGVIGLFWASLRILSGDAPLSPELEALDAAGHAVDALASRKTMLVRALKDLDIERSLGKLDDDDHAQLSATYRGELKDVLRKIDASLEPLRPKAEEAAKRHLAKVGLADGAGYRGVQPDDVADKSDDDDTEDAEDTEGDSSDATETKPTRVDCASCKTTNDADAAFCKKCGKALVAAANDEKADDERAVDEKTKESSE